MDNGWTTRGRGVRCGGHDGRVNRNGHPQTLVASHPGHANNQRARGAYSPRLREPRAQEIAASVMAAPWASDVDELGAVEIGRLEALIERIDEALADGRLEGSRGSVRALVAMRLRASGRLQTWLDRYGLTPLARSEFANRLASEIGRASCRERV